MQSTDASSSNSQGLNPVEQTPTFRVLSEHVRVKEEGLCHVALICPYRSSG